MQSCDGTGHMGSLGIAWKIGEFCINVYNLLYSYVIKEYHASSDAEDVKEVTFVSFYFIGGGIH